MPQGFPGGKSAFFRVNSAFFRVTLPFSGRYPQFCPLTEAAELVNSALQQRRQKNPDNGRIDPENRP